MQMHGLERLIGYQFKQQSLLQQALTHRSHGSLNNERLEFLGDGVLNFIIAHQLYLRFRDLSEGDLSRMRAQLVKEPTLGEVALGLNLGDHLRLGEGELKSGGWRRPSVLADALEAIIGAAYLDGGFEAAEQMVIRLFTPLLEKLDPKAIGKDPKSLLQEYLQGRKMELPEYKVLSTEGEAHCQTFRVECHVGKLNITTSGEGTSRRAAEQQAAELAYKKVMHVQEKN
ncbi:MAG: ribonuclease III [Betaproteobacteria bacterium HGW-Betaproteobacteria-1]|jgi:ribonuclease-3|nr:MAG: ribonuclease III [Betaproteobacteria bacterium HGW-Betaproteobacteria-1]